MNITIIDIITNRHKKYEGDLIHYFKQVIQAQNMQNPFHGIRHMLHVTYMCYQACCHLNVGRRDMRNTLIGALMHDLGHSGHTGNDAAEIATALELFQQICLPEDIPYKNIIAGIINATQYPHQKDPANIMQCIIRDADISYTLSDTWIETTLFDLSRESGSTPKEMLEKQIQFLDSIHFYTTWGQDEFYQKIIARKIEVEKMLTVWV